MTDRIQQIHTYLGSEASDEECRRLEAWMKEDESHVDLFVREALLHQQLREALRDEASAPAQLDDEKDPPLPTGIIDAAAGGPPCVPRDNNLPPVMDLLPGSSVFHVWKNGFRPWLVPVFGVLLAVGVGGWFLGIGGWSLRDGGQSRPQARSTTSTAMLASITDAVATVEESSKCIWGKSQAGSIASGLRVSPRRVLNLLDGTARVKFDCGAAVTLTGPALMQIDSAMDVTLHHGDLSVNVPDVARGFLVHTSEMDVLDLGTEFKLNVDNQGQTELEVVEGEVEASLLHKESAEKKIHSLGVGEYLLAGRSASDDRLSSQRLDVFRGVRVDFTTRQGINLLKITNKNTDRYRHDPAHEYLSVDTAWGSVYRSNGEGENFFLLPAPRNDDFDVVLSVARFVPKRLSEHVGLVILDDADNYSRMIYGMGYSHEGTYVKFTVETDADPSVAIREPVGFDNGPFQLRLARRGSEISGWWSRDGKHWNLRDRATVPHATRHVGFYVSKGHPYPKNATPYRQALIEEFKIEIKE